MDNITAKSSLDWLSSHGFDIPIHIKVGAIKLKIINTREYKQIGEYSSIRNELWIVLYDSIYDFLNSNAQVGTYTSKIGTSLSKAYIDATDLGYQDGGGTLPLDEDTASWARSELNAQLAYIDSLFNSLKQLRREGDFDAIHEAYRHADGYCNSLDALYNGAKIAGAGNKMLTFEGSDGRESCKDCQRYKGQRHRASWWKSHNAVPPSREFECKGFHCDHRLFDDDGDEFTI